MGGVSEPGCADPGRAGRDPLAAGSAEAAGTLPALLLEVFFLDMASGRSVHSCCGRGAPGRPTACDYRARPGPGPKPVPRRRQRRW